MLVVETIGKRPVITGCLEGDACWMMEAPERR